jgi:hypothetical protein
LKDLSFWKGEERFLNCSKNVICANLTKELNCTIAGFDEFLYKCLQLPECTNLSEATEANKKIQAIYFGFAEDTESFGCKVLCERITYSMEVNTIHINSLLFDGEPEPKNTSYYHLFYYFKTYVIKKQFEVLVYDLGGFLAAAGGNLGLCLGFSFLSILFTITHWTKFGVDWLQQHLKKPIK